MRTRCRVRWVVSWYNERRGLDSQQLLWLRAWRRVAAEQSVRTRGYYTKIVIEVLGLE